MWIWIANKFAKFHAKRLNRSENIPKSLRGGLFFETPCTYGKARKQKYFWLPFRFHPMTLVTKVPALPTSDRPGSTMMFSVGQSTTAELNCSFTASTRSAGDGMVTYKHPSSYHYLTLKNVVTLTGYSKSLKTRSALGRVHLPPTTVFRRLKATRCCFDGSQYQYVDGIFTT